MHPSPSADTLSPLRPSSRNCIMAPCRENKIPAACSLTDAPTLTNDGRIVNRVSYLRILMICGSCGEPRLEAIRKKHLSWMNRHAQHTPVVRTQIRVLLPHRAVSQSISPFARHSRQTG